MHVFGVKDGAIDYVHEGPHAALLHAGDRRARRGAAGGRRLRARHGAERRDRPGTRVRATQIPSKDAARIPVADALRPLDDERRVARPPAASSRASPAACGRPSGWWRDQPRTRASNAPGPLRLTRQRPLVDVRAPHALRVGLEQRRRRDEAEERAVDAADVVARDGLGHLRAWNAVGSAGAATRSMSSSSSPMSSVSYQPDAMMPNDRIVQAEQRAQLRATRARRRGSSPARRSVSANQATPARTAVPLMRPRATATRIALDGARRGGIEGGRHESSAPRRRRRAPRRRHARATDGRRRAAGASATTSLGAWPAPSADRRARPASRREQLARRGDAGEGALAQARADDVHHRAGHAGREHRLVAQDGGGGRRAAPAEGRLARPAIS